MLSKGASVDIAYFFGTPLYIAAAYGKHNVMKVLLEHHSDPNRVSEELGSPLVATLNATAEEPTLNANAQGLNESDILKCEATRRDLLLYVFTSYVSTFISENVPKPLLD